MKTCKNCGYENPEGMSFCVKCGTSLSAKPKIVKCPKCGAAVKPEFEFCGKCGAAITAVPEPAPSVSAEEAKKPTQKEVVCKACGAVVPSDALFCMQCGTRADKNICPACGANNDADALFCASCGNRISQGERHAAAPVAKAPVATTVAAKPVKEKTSGMGVRQKVVKFERERALVRNLVVAVLTFVLALVSLFAPIKITDAFPVSSTEIEAIEYEQSVWQILGATGAIGLDVTDSGDRAKIKRIYDEYNVKQQKAEAEIAEYIQLNPRASQEDIIEETKEIVVEIMSDVNILEYNFAISTIGAYDFLFGEGEEIKKAEELDYTYTTALTTYIFAMIVVFIQFAIAIVSIVFFILSIIGLCRKKAVSLSKVFVTLLALSGAGLAVTMVAPGLAAGGALLADALLTGLAFFGCGLTFAIFKQKRVIYIVKHAVIAGLSFIAAMLMCDYVVDITMTASYGGVSQEVVTSAPLGVCFDQILSCAMLTKYEGFTIIYSSLSIASGIIALALGLCSFILLFFMAEKALYRLLVYPESKKKFSVDALLAVIMLFLFAVVPAIFGAADSLPSVKQEHFAGMISVAATAPVYVALVFTVAVFVLGLALNPRSAHNDNAVAMETAVLPEPEVHEQAQNEAETAEASDMTE